MLKKRVGVLSEPGYSVKLQQEVLRLNENIAKSTTENQLLKLREKNTTRKLENAKDSEANKGLSETSTHSLLNKKMQLEGMVERKEKKLKEIELKVQVLIKKSEHTETEIKNHLKKGPGFPDTSLLVRYKSLESVLLKSQRGLNQIQRSYRSKLENLSNELRKIQATHSNLSQKFESSFKTLKKIQGTHSVLSKRFECSFKSPKRENNLLRSLKSL